MSKLNNDRPNFIIIGAQKAGTNWIGNMLNQHPDIYLYLNREIAFFCWEKNLAKGKHWYSAHFDSITNEKAIGEKSPAYMWTNIELPGLSKRIAENIAAYSQEMKLISILRNPVERAISHVMHLMRYGRISPLLNLNDILSKNAGGVLAQYKILEIGQYYQQLARYFDTFDPRNLLVLINEIDIKTKPEQTLAKLCHFLEVDTSYEFQKPNQKIYKNEFSSMRMILNYYLRSCTKYFHLVDNVFPPKKRTVNQETLNYLNEYYADSNKKLETLLGIKLLDW